MKKKYINPQTNIIQISIAHMIAISSADFTREAGDQINNVDDFGAREYHSIWDDEEE